jgi:hypothetical protein
VEVGKTGGGEEGEDGGGGDGVVGGGERPGVWKLRMAHAACVEIDGVAERG